MIVVAGTDYGDCGDRLIMMIVVAGSDYGEL